MQTNKVNKVVGRAALIESVDSEHLLQKVERAAAAANLTQEILIEINIGGEESKSGVSAESLWPLLDMAAAQPHIRLRGLMAIPPAAATPDETRAFFAQMRELLAKAAGRHYENAKMDILSMGMSGDYPDAIREGSVDLCHLGLDFRNHARRHIVNGCNGFVAVFVDCARQTPDKH